MNNLLMGTVVTVSPLTVKLTPEDVAISVVSTTGLVGIAVGSRVLLTKFGNKFIATAVIGLVETPAMQLYRCTANQDLSSTVLTNIAGMVFTIPANSGYWEINVHVNARNATSATPDVKFDWEVTGADYYTIVGRNCRGGEYQATNTTTLSLTRNSAGHGWATDVFYPLPAVNGNSYITEQSIVLAGVSDTIFQLRAAQVNADAVNVTTISGYSHIIITKLANLS